MNKCWKRILKKRERERVRKREKKRGWIEAEILREFSGCSWGNRLVIYYATLVYTIRGSEESFLRAVSVSGPDNPTLKSCTPMTANTNCRRLVTRTMFPIVFTATMTHCTTCWVHNINHNIYSPFVIERWGYYARRVALTLTSFIAKHNLTPYILPREIRIAFSNRESDLFVESERNLDFIKILKRRIT